MKKENTFKKIVAEIEPIGAGVEKVPRKLKGKAPRGPGADEIWKSEGMSPAQELARQAQNFYAEEEAEQPRDTKHPPTGPEGGPAGPPAPDAEVERKNREEFERIKKEFDENEKKIAESRYKAKSRWQVIKETLGTKGKMIEGEEITAYTGKRKELWKKLMELGRIALRGNEEEYQDFVIRYDRETVAINSRVLETDIRAQNAKWPAKALIGFMRLSGIYRTFISKQFLNEKGKLSFKGVAKGTAIAASISIALATALGVALPALGVAAISAGTLSAWSMRIFGGAGAGYVAKKRMEADFLESKKREIEERVKRKIEDLKNKTDGDWEKMIAGMQLETSIEGKEQEFADVDARHKKMALAIGSGTIVASALVSHFIMPHARGLFGQAWEKVTHSFSGGKPGIIPTAMHSPMVGAEVQPHAGGAAEKFLGDTHTIRSGENIWKVTRDIYSENPRGYGYDPGDPKVEKLFQSFKRQGILGRMGIEADSFSDLSPEEKIKIWAENRTANSVRGLAEFQGGRVRDLVHAGDTVVVKPDGTIIFDNASGIKTGYLHHDIPQGTGAGKAAAESYVGKGGVGQAAAETPAPGAGKAAETWRQSEVARLGAEAQASNEQAIVGLTSANARLWNSWLGNLGGFKLNTPASEIQEAIGRLSPGITSDMPLPPTDEEMIQRGSAISFTQETFQKFPPLNARETMQQYLERMSRTNFNLFKALSIKNRL